MHIRIYKKYKSWHHHAIVSLRMRRIPISYCRTRIYTKTMSSENVDIVIFFRKIRCEFWTRSRGELLIE